MADGSFVPFSADGAPVEKGVRDQVRVLPERIEPVKLPKSYYLSGFATVLGLVLLIAGYLALPISLVGGFAYLVYESFAQHWMSRASDYKLFLALFFGVGGMIGLLVFFMVRPIFERRGLEPQFLQITERDQGLFFAFLQRLCRAIEAPMPDEVALDCTVNAGARRISGFWGRERLQLMIGAPLIQALSAAQLAGVIAHELAHFRQRGGRRLGYSIERMLGFLERLAFERSRRDRWLAEKYRRAKDEPSLGEIVFYGGALGLVWLARKICQGLAYVGRVISAHHRRQLEYDADRWQARLVGSSQFAGLMREIALLDIAYSHAMESIAQHEEEGRYPVDLADYGLAFRRKIDEETSTAIWQSMLELKTGLTDSHPAFRDRLANVAAYEQTPPPELDIPALDLFREWRGLSRFLTRVQYCFVLGEAILPGNLFATEELLGGLERNSAEQEALRRFFGGGWPWLRPLRLSAMLDFVQSESDKALASNPLAELTPALVNQAKVQRDVMLRESARALASQELFWQGVQGLLGARVGEQLQQAGATEELRRLEMPADPNALVVEQQKAVRQIRQADTELAAFESAVALRLALALAGPREKEFSELRQKAAKLIAFLRALEPEIERMRGILIERAMLLATFDLGEEFGFPEGFLEKRSALAGGLMTRLKQIYANFEGIAHPLDEDEESASVAQWLLLLPESTFASIFTSAKAVVESLPVAIFRTLGRLALIVEEIEAKRGLAPLDLTPKGFA